MRMVVPAIAIARMNAGTMNMPRLPSGSSAKRTNSGLGDHPHQIAG